MRHWGLLTLIVLLLAMFAGVMTLEPIAQSPMYHDFADRRFLFGVPNMLNVVSNIAFVIVGVMGIALCVGSRRPEKFSAWFAFFIVTVLTGVGSAYYHWAPDNTTLAWDRLPLALSVMALFVALVAEHAGETRENISLVTALAVGAASVYWWWWSGDLRPYLWVQFAPLVCIFFLLAMFPARYTHRHYILFALGLYGVAKLAEMNDLEIFLLTGHIVSGHTLKHLFAAGAIVTLLIMLRRRQSAPKYSDSIPNHVT